MSAQMTFTHEETLMWLQKAAQASREGNDAEHMRIAKMLPLTPAAAAAMQFVNGIDYLEKEGYNTSELTFDETGMAIYR